MVNFPVIWQLSARIKLLNSKAEWNIPKKIPKNIPPQIKKKNKLIIISTQVKSYLGYQMA